MESVAWCACIGTMSLSAPCQDTGDTMLAPGLAGEYTFAAPIRQLERRFVSMAPNTRHLVVNADDFGISRGVNRGIVEAHQRGLVTSASLMANLPAADDALTRAAICPDLGLGLHLTMTAGRPLSPPQQVSTLIDANGEFLVLGALLTRLSLGQSRRA